MKKHNLFATITKVDATEGLVYGRLTQEVNDKSGETLDYEKSKPLFENWSNEAAKATDGKSLGNVREMHQLRAVGKLTAIDFLDGEKAIDICAKVADQDVLDKCIEGIYTGFSVGGKLVKRWKDGETMKIIIDPSEASIVDNPCVPTAHFQYIKAAGADPETRAFKLWEPTSADVSARAEEIAKADGGVWSDHIEAARAALIADHAKTALGDADDDETDEGEPTPVLTTEADPAAPAVPADPAAPETEIVDTTDKADQPEWQQVWQTRDGRTFAKKADAVEHAGAVRAGTSRLATALKSLSGAPSETPATVDRIPVIPGFRQTMKTLLDLRAKFEDHVVIKGLYSVRTLAALISELGYVTSDCMWEADYEGDGSPIPAALAQQVAALGQILIDMAREEINELVASLRGAGVEIDVEEMDDVDGEVVEMAAEGNVLKASAAWIAKAGARNSKSDQQRLQDAHDAIAACGAKCDKANLAEEEKADGVDVLKAENSALRKLADEAAGSIETIQKAMSDMREELDALKAQPTQGAPRLVVTEKGFDAPGGYAGQPSQDDIAKALAQMTPEQLTNLAIRQAQKHPQFVVQPTGQA